MIYLLYGPDEFAREAFIADLAKQHHAARVNFSADAAPTLDALASQDLFSGAQVMVLRGKVGEILTEEVIPALAESQNHVVFVETELDLRTKLAKGLLADKRVTAKQYAVPTLTELPVWVAGCATSLGGNMSAGAARLLCQRLGYVDPIGGMELAARPVSLGRIRQEVEKLVVYAAGSQISERMITELVADEQQVISLAIADAVAKKNATSLGRLLAGYYESSAEDEQGKTLALMGLLAEQFRSQLLVKEALQDRVADQDILALTGWKPGRLFVVKRLAGSCTSAQLREALIKLESLDVELKTSITPPRVVLELILAQMV